MRSVDEIDIKQGRNSVDDGDYLDNFIVEYSVDGKDWKALSKPLEKTYEFFWKGEPVDARYIRMRRLDSDRKSWASVRQFHVNPLTPERTGVNPENAHLDKALKAFDENPLTSFNIAGPLSFDRLQGASQLVLLLGDIMGPFTVEQLDAKGYQVAENRISTPYSTVNLAPSTTRIVVKGHAAVYELVQR